MTKAQSKSSAPLTDKQQQQAMEFFTLIQNRLVEGFQDLDPKGSVDRRSWKRETGEGGGLTCEFRGSIVEKAGANVSQVMGDEYPSIESEHAGKPFVAGGVSTITHMYNPYAPIAHANLRLIKVGDTFWFGGGGDLTPCFPFEEDTQAFHQALKTACDKYKEGSYDKFSKWCDEYFYIKHRKSTRGVGGIFFDYLSGDFDTLFSFVQDVGHAYVDAYFSILKKRVDTPFTEQEKEKQLYWRGRYVEFNLVYDRGTKFGLMTGGNIDSIFVSLPPIVKW